MTERPESSAPWERSSTANRDADQQEQEQALEARLNELAGKGFLLESEMAALIRFFAPVLGEEEVRRRALGRLADVAATATTEMDDMDSATVPPRPAVGPEPEADVYRARTERVERPTRPLSRPPRRPRRRRAPKAAGWALAAAAVLAVAVLLTALVVRPSWLMSSGSKTATHSQPTARPRISNLAQATHIAAQLRHWYTTWRVSVACACDKGLAAVETGHILATNQRILQRLHAAGSHWTITPSTWHIDWIQLEVPGHAHVQVSASDHRQRVNGTLPPACYRGSYTDLYTLIKQGGVWKVTRRQTVTPQARCTGPTPATPQVAVLGFLHVWESALGTNDGSKLPQVATGQGLSEFQATLRQHQQQKDLWQVTDLRGTPVIVSSTIHGQEATVVVRREIRVVVLNADSGQRKPAAPGNQTDQILQQTYTLRQSNGRWLVSSRT